ncbi:MAG: glycoside hydrolase family 97 protein [Lewinellaceae bacterium]|nr:glycoside hydrolase family 97 protein [Lewinellaceae bacterium]
MRIRTHLLLLALAALTAAGCGPDQKQTTTLTSPGEKTTIEFALAEDGSPTYRVAYEGATVIDTSTMGFDFQGQPALQKGMKITGVKHSTTNETWEMPWGEQREVLNHYNEMVVSLQEAQAPKRTLNIYFRAYDDGIGFRYEFPRWEGVDTLVIQNENTQFRLTGDHTCWWIPGDWDNYEHLYHTTKLSEIDALSVGSPVDHGGRMHIAENAVNTPVTMKTAEGLYLSFHEANLTDYAGMTLVVDPANLALRSGLVRSDRLGYSVKRALPFQTPWRSIQIARRAGDLIESNLIVNLNDPNRLGDVSWFKPKKYVGIWWEMHLGLSTWDYEITQSMNNWVGEDVGNVGHGATTANAKRYIDFAAANHITGLLVEGWNTGWDHWAGFEDREGVFDFVTPYPDYDLEEVVRYGKEKGVELIMHHETSAATRTYEQQMDTAFALMQRLGLHSVKTGYVGTILPKGEYHHGQYMVQHYRKVLETAANYQIAINAHEPIKDTGIRRTLPNAIAREGLRGQEYNAWSPDGGNPPEHLPIVAFTRMLSGPIDFTPGVFELSLKNKPNNQVNTTLAQQLALYVVIYSPIQMACDLPQNYEGNPALQFIRDVGVDWEQTRVLDGEVGDFVTIARQERGTGNWFVGSITDENPREVTINFDFLEDGVTYKAAIYKDGPGAHWKDNPTSIQIETAPITKGQEMTFALAPGGGLAVSLMRE